MNWFKSYLTDRQQTTIVRNIPSTPLNVKCGVPQGSVLGPTLFLIFINLSKSLKWSKDIFFADDVVIYTSGDEKDEEVNDDIANLHTWCIQNAITMNVKKTKYMSFGTRQRLNLCSQNTETLYNKTLEKADSYTYLGTLLYSNLNFTCQANETIKLVNFRLHCLSRIKSHVSSEVMITLYKSYIQPYFDYNDVFLKNTHVR